MSEAAVSGADAPVGLPDVPLILEDLLSQFEHLRAISGDPAAIADLRTRVELLQAR